MAENRLAQNMYTEITESVVPPEVYYTTLLMAKLFILDLFINGF